MRKRTIKVNANRPSPAPNVCGFTGTMQEFHKHPGNPEYVRERICWYVCYAPVEKPKWALTVLLQHGRSGGNSSAPIAHRILDVVAAVEGGTRKMELKAHPPVQGHLDVVDPPSTQQDND